MLFFPPNPKCSIFSFKLFTSSSILLSSLTNLLFVAAIPLSQSVDPLVIFLAVTPAARAYLNVVEIVF